MLGQRGRRWLDAALRYIDDIKHAVVTDTAAHAANLFRSKIDEDCRRCCRADAACRAAGLLIQYRRVRDDALERGRATRYKEGVGLSEDFTGYARRGSVITAGRVRR